jgi:hypothetical protein
MTGDDPGAAAHSAPAPWPTIHRVRRLSAAQAHVTQQASLITSLQSCLVGVEQALNELAVGNQTSAIAALNGVSTSCTAAEASSG